MQKVYVEVPRGNSFLCTLAGVKSVFLAGTIDMNNSVDWQADIIQRMEKDAIRPINVLNPRRAGFHDFTEDEQRFQINWELDRLFFADYVLMHFADDSKSPVSMLELGSLLGTHRNVIVSCSPAFYRYMNIEMTCLRFGINVFHGLDNAYQELMMRLQ